MLRIIGGRTREVLTAVSIFHPGQIVDTRVDATTVEFGELSESDIEWYVSSGEPMDSRRLRRAGAGLPLRDADRRSYPTWLGCRSLSSIRCSRPNC